MFRHHLKQSEQVFLTAEKDYGSEEQAVTRILEGKLLAVRSTAKCINIVKKGFSKHYPLRLIKKFDLPYSNSVASLRTVLQAVRGNA